MIRMNYNGVELSWKTDDSNGVWAPYAIRL
jgi:hypothetical protein